jgi:serine phosphatase RsbU (regulator of sigma subunit)
VGVGGEEPQVREHTLERGDRVLLYTDGVTEEHEAGQEPFGEQQFIDCVNRIEQAAEGVRGGVRWLSHTLRRERGWRTSDDATLFLIEWRGGAADHLAVLE